MRRRLTCREGQARNSACGAMTASRFHTLRRHGDARRTCDALCRSERLDASAEPSMGDHMTQPGTTRPLDFSAGASARQTRRRLGSVPALFAFAIAMASSVLPATAQERVRLATTAGNIVIQLDSAKAPRSVENFVQYVRDGHYDGTIFHRVVENFVIQGGGFSVDRSEKPTRAPIPLERNGLSNTRGTVAMARGPEPNSARAQFFINVRDNEFLNAAQSRDGNGYTVFGRVISGMDTVEKIRVGSTEYDDFPFVPVIIKLASLERAR